MHTKAKVLVTAKETIEYVHSTHVDIVLFYVEYWNIFTFKSIFWTEVPRKIDE